MVDSVIRFVAGKGIQIFSLNMEGWFKMSNFGIEICKVISKFLILKGLENRLEKGSNSNLL